MVVVKKGDKMKKFITVFLSLVMVLTMCVTPTFATLSGDADVENLGGKGNGMQLIQGALANAYGCLEPNEEKTYKVEIPFDSVIRFDFFPAGHGDYQVSIPELDYSHSADCNFWNQETDNVVYQVTPPGTYTVKVKSKEYSQKADYNFTVRAYPVKNVPATSVDVSKFSGTLKVGNTAKMSCDLIPYYATDEFTWSTSNKKIATVDKKGIVTGQKMGTVKITAKSKISGKKDSTNVTVSKMDFNMWTSEKPNLTNYVNGISGYKTGKWSSSKTSVAKISSSGKLTPKKSGKTTVKFKCKGKTYTFNVYCYSKSALKSKALTCLKIFIRYPEDLRVDKVTYSIGKKRAGVSAIINFSEVDHGYVYNRGIFLGMASNNKYSYI